MKTLAGTLLAIGLVTSGSAFAQSTYYPSNGSYNGGYNQDQGYNQNQSDGYQRDGYQQGDVQYDYARVIRVDPVLGNFRSNTTASYGSQRCHETQTAGGYSRDGYGSAYGNGYQRDNRYQGQGGYYGNDQYGGSQYGVGTQTGRNVAAIVGGIAGAVLGSKIGGGTGSYAATAIGSMVGGMAGRQVYERTQQNRYVRPGVVRVCDPEPVGRDSGYYSRTGDSRSSAYDVTYEYNGRRYTRRMDYNPGNRVRVRVDVSPQ
ncbi:MAG: glycine zipper 2TM domain-containing protein [Pseudomonadota bacterium]|nr:glycine zipper 2TM domain-containing protein [Pseudomonadota bacterium]